MSASSTPTTTEVYSVVARRAALLIAEAGEALGEVARAALEREGHALAPSPTTLWPVSVVYACVAAGGDWRHAVWPAVALECAIVAGDLFDDVADGEDTDLRQRYGGGELVTTAAGLVALAGDAVLRATDDGVEPRIALRLGRALGSYLARAADGQTCSLRGLGPADEPVVAAYRLAALKSGPLGALAVGLGAIVAGAEGEVLARYQEFGWHLAVTGQLANDTHDALPNRPSRKRDVRDGVPTVPLVFANSRGAPAELEGDALSDWEAAERRRIAAEGGIIVSELLAMADRRRAEQAMERLELLGHDVGALAPVIKRAFHSDPVVASPSS